MDTVIGRQGGKVILTLLFTICNFMVGILLDSKSALAVSQKFRHLREKFAAAQTPFEQLFPLILTDNGGEFANIHSIECNAAGTRETHLFFCDTMKSSQKPRVEKTYVAAGYLPQRNQLRSNDTVAAKHHIPAHEQHLQKAIQRQNALPVILLISRKRDG